MGQLGDFYHNTYQEGRREVLSAVIAEEDNLLAAWRLARAHGWWDMVIGAMQGLRTLYDATDRRAAWRRLVDDVVPDFVDIANDGPLASREDQWSLVTEYRVRLAGEGATGSRPSACSGGSWPIRTDNVAAALATAPDQRDATQRHAINDLAIFTWIGCDSAGTRVARPAPRPFARALDLHSTIGETALQAVDAFNLGHVYVEIADLRNPDEAERWYRMSLELPPPTTELGRGQCVAQLGLVAYERFVDAQTAERPVEELARHLIEAARLYEQALDMMPATAVTERGDHSQPARHHLPQRRRHRPRAVPLPAGYPLL
jgi:hypothetical protein